MIKNANILTLRDDGISDSPLLKKNFVSQNGQQWIITKRLNEEIALQNQLALNLSYLFAKSEVLRSRADSLDRTSQPDEFLDGEGRNTSTASLRIVDESDEQFLLMTILILY